MVRAERARQMRGEGGFDATLRDPRLLDRLFLRRDTARASNLDADAVADAAIVLRLAGVADSAALADLAGLDSAGVPAEPVLIAEAGGEIRAALSLRDGALIADPFHRTLAARELLRARAAQLRADPGPARRRPLRRAAKTATACTTDPSAAMGATNHHQ